MRIVAVVSFRVHIRCTTRQSLAQIHAERARTSVGPSRHAYFSSPLIELAYPLSGRAGDPVCGVALAEGRGSTLGRGTVVMRGVGGG